MYSCKHAYMYTHTRHVHRSTYVHIYMYMVLHLTIKHAYRHTQTFINMHRHLHIGTWTHIHGLHSCIHPYMHTCTQTSRHSNTHTHSSMHPCVCQPMDYLFGGWGWRDVDDSTALHMFSSPMHHKMRQPSQGLQGHIPLNCFPSGGGCSFWAPLGCSQLSNPTDEVLIHVVPIHGWVAQQRGLKFCQFRK